MTGDDPRVPPDEPDDDPRDATADEAPPAAGAAAPPPPRRIVRYPDRGPVAGVSEGLGLHFGVDPVVLRIVFVALAILTFPLGVVLYAICWIAIPPAGAEADRAAPARQHGLSEQRTRTWLGVTLLVIGGVWLLGQLAALPAAGLFGFDALGQALTSGSLLAVLLVGGGVALLVLDRREPGPTDADPGTGTRPPEQSSAPAWQRDDRPVAGTTAAAATAPAETTAAPRPPRSRLGRLTAGAAMVVLGVMWWLDQVGAIDTGPRDALAVALLVVGGALIVGAWWGRSRGLIAWGVILSLLVLAASIPRATDLADVRAVAAGEMGDRTWQPATVAEIEPSYELGMGDATLDLSGVDFDGAEADIDASVGMGELTVYVPDDVDVDVAGSVRLGELRLFDVTASGMGQLRREVVDTVEDPAGTLDLTATVGMGQLDVERR